MMTYLEPIRGAVDSWIGFGVEDATTVQPRLNAASDYARVRAILAARRSRGKCFDEALFADPAWDMLLELFGAHLGQFDVSISSLCVGAAVPPTTALRWINTMERQGLVVRRADPQDKRRVFVALSEVAVRNMDKLFESSAASETLV